MTSLGYAMAFMLCAEDGSACETLAIRASRFATLSQCRETIADALRAATRTSSNPANLSASCRSLEELCGPDVAAANHFTKQQPSVGALVVHIRFDTARGSSPAIDGALSMLCRKPPESDCFS
ncbi:MAG: hypothetical protein ABL907_22880 [Hyphomicrobium sp.]